MGELHIRFSGICVSLHRGVVPGVPMRTVLPNALQVRFGIVRIPSDDGFLHNVEYYLMPHLAVGTEQLLVGTPYQFNGQYIRVLNAKDQPLCRADGGYSLTEFKPDVQLDPDVVFGGNALAYVDIFGGRVWTEQESEQHPATTHVVVKTHGTPRVGIWSLPGNVQPWAGDTTANAPIRESIETAIETNELYISNLDLEGAAEDFQFDFLLNFLVARGGIPQQLSKRTPGMTGEPKALTLNRLGERLKALGTLIETEGGTFAGWQASVREGDEPEPHRPLPITPPVSRQDQTLVGKIAKRGILPLPFDPSCSTSNFP